LLFCPPLLDLAVKEKGQEPTLDFLQ